MPAPDDFDRLADLLGDVCEVAASPSPASSAAPAAREARQAARRAAPGDTARAVALAWPEVAGDEVAANATPVQLKNGRLTVSTSSSVWAHTLQYMSSDLAARLNGHLGTEAIREIVFRHAGWEERPRDDTRGRADQVASDPPAGVGGVGLSAEQKQALADAEALDLPPEIKEKVTRAMRASFVRAQRNLVR